MTEPVAEITPHRQVCREHPREPVSPRGTGCRRCRAEREATEQQRRHRRHTDRENPTQ
jgi:hypothetical protein